jgi:hypothetical protein
MTSEPVPTTDGRPARWIAAAAVLLGLLLLWRFGVLASAWEAIERGGHFVAVQYGIDLRLTVAGFATAQIVYIWSVAMMLKEAGKTDVTWRDIRRFKLRDLKLGNSRMMAWLAVNRMSWIVFWTVIIVVTWGRVPWWATTAAFADNASTVFWWVVAAAGLNLPWWNRRPTTEP